MSEVLTIHEWEAVLLERARPADLLPGETIARYVHRKFEALIKDRDRLKADYAGLMEDCAGCL